MEGILSDGSTYEVVNYDPLKKIISFLTFQLFQDGNKKNIYIHRYLHLQENLLWWMITYLELTGYQKFTTRIAH